MRAMRQELPEGTVTVVFTDVVGSTVLTNRLGDEPARALLREVEGIVRGQIERHRGVEVKGLGDGQMVAFTSARRAVLCAVGVQKALARWRREREEVDDLALRVGLHTGEVIREQADLFGAAVNFAARVAARADAGEVLVSEATKAVLGSTSDIGLDDRGETELKGFPGLWRLFAVRLELEPDERSTTDSGEVPYVGRLAERAVIREALTRARQGAGSMVFLGGEPGIGKTRLATETMAEARYLGFFTGMGHCYETEGTPPFVPFVEVFDYSFRVVPKDRLRTLIGEEGPEIARIAPRLRTVFSDLPLAVDLPPEQARHYLFSCVGDYLERATKIQPLLLVMDDLHWADESTLLLFEYLAGRLNEMALLVLGTYRDTDLEVTRPFARTLDRFTRQSRVQRLSLARFDRAGVAALLAAMSGKPPPPRLVDVVTAETEGVPFFVQEVYRYLDEQGRLFGADGAWRGDVAMGEVEVPEGVRLVVGRRLERLSEATRRVLTQASVIGRDFGFELLAALSDVGEDAVLDAVEEAEAAHLVVARSVREARYAFSHEQIRQTLLGTLSLPRRQRLHLRVADALEKSYAANLEEHAAELAHHLYQAGAAADAEKTVRYQIMAADLALKAFGYEDALKLCDNGLSIVDTPEGRRRADLLDRRAHALRSLGRLDDALADWAAAVEIHESLADAEAAGRIWAAMALDLSWAYRIPEAVRAARRGLAALGERVNADRCLLLAGQAASLSWLATRSSAQPPLVPEAIAGPDSGHASTQAMFAEAVQLAEELGDKRTLGMVLAYRGSSAAAQARYPEALDDCLRAGRLLLLAGAPYEATTALPDVLVSAVFTGRLNEADEMATEFEPLMRFGHEGAGQTAVVFRAVIRLMRSGDIRAFAGTCDEVLPAALASNNVFNVGVCRLYLAAAGWWGGRWEEAERHLKQIVDSPAGLLQKASGLLRLRAYGGAREEALSIWQAHRSDLPAKGDPLDPPARLMLLTAIESLAILGRGDQAAELYPFIAAANAFGVVDVSSGLVHKFAGIAAACGRQWVAAEEHFETALRQAHEIPHKIEQPEVRRWYSDMLIERGGPGDVDRARALLAEAIAMYTTIGMPRHIELAERVLARA